MLDSMTDQWVDGCDEDTRLLIRQSHPMHELLCSIDVCDTGQKSSNRLQNAFVTSEVATVW